MAKSNNPNYKPRFKSEVNKFIDLLGWLQQMESYIDNLGSAVGSGDFKLIRTYLSWEEQYYYNIYSWLTKNKAIKFNVEQFNALFKEAQILINESDKLRREMDPIEDDEDELREDMKEITEKTERVAQILKKINLKLWNARDQLGLNGVKFRKQLSEREILSRGVIGNDD